MKFQLCKLLRISKNILSKTNCYHDTQPNQHIFLYDAKFVETLFELYEEVFIYYTAIVFIMIYISISITPMVKI